MKRNNEQQLHIFEQQDTLLSSLADFIVAESKQAITREGRFSLVLSGGSSPKRLYELLASDAYRDQVEWNKVFFFFGDERYVPLTDVQSNYLMAKTALFDPLQIATDHIYAMDTAQTPEEAALCYQQDLEAYFGTKTPHFDIILLGLGDNVHTASLFPYTQLLHEQKAWVKAEYINEVKMNRITLTAPIINQANHIAFLIFGAGKAEAIQSAMSDTLDIDKYPAQLIQPDHGVLHWFLDQDAARLVE
ncbi:6-phosphogluconolactonase [Reichenbachiella agarivorans]|uniref:6-phosphogluconolactonase n=1 Tax=Reichenbachiella agarivorans TaxID=2979464 RepID=A0ABY6CQE4_9BACT|nr:6-phosphogluconolactonase [Reichenbachiella agarivorans]UXP31573.1 6-phosphogluconolactonase [Reichenbachiella agarivorans]